MVMGDVAMTWSHPLEAVMVFVTVYVPAVLAARFTCPVEGSVNNNPAVEENTPLTAPEPMTGDGFAEF